FFPGCGIDDVNCLVPQAVSPGRDICIILRKQIQRCLCFVKLLLEGIDDTVRLCTVFTTFTGWFCCQYTNNAADMLRCGKTALHCPGDETAETLQAGGFNGNIAVDDHRITVATFLAVRNIHRG